MSHRSSLRVDRLEALAPQRNTPASAALPGHVALFCVGGAVRDALLDRPSSDLDFLVVGATPETMVRAGFRPVGRDFPVFLHPQTHQEFALARTERKSGRGYHGFVFQADASVRLEDDLARRDLTINAMAVDEQGALHDPFDGSKDLLEGRLRHVGEAFSEDPVRVLRLARFLARWPEMSIDPTTLELCREMQASGELESLVAERVWHELQRGLSEPSPEAMVSFLDSIHAWEGITGASTPSPNALALLRQLTQDRQEPSLRAGLLWGLHAPQKLLHVIPKAIAEWRALVEEGLHSQGLRASLSDQDNASAIGRAALVEATIDWAKACDLFRRSERLDGLMALFECLYPGQMQGFKRLAALLPELISLPVGNVAQIAAQRHESVEQAVRTHRINWLLQALERQ